MSARLLRNLVLIHPLPEGDVRKQGPLVVISNDTTAPKQGLVIDVGPGKTVDGKLVAVTVKKGDHVVYVMNNCQEVKIGRDKFHVLPDAEILCVLEDK